MSNMESSDAGSTSATILPALIDTHCHLDAEAFHQELEAVVQRAVSSGVERLITIGTTRASSEAAVVISNRFPVVRAAVGIHPNYAPEAKPGDWDHILDLALHPHVVGIGETGLDKYWDFAPLEVQREFFVEHIQLSRRCHKPFIVHCREAEAEVLDVLRAEFDAHGPLNGVMHSFCGDATVAAECLAMGLHISFAGMASFRKSSAMRDVAATVPLDRILVETDAPYLAPHPNRGKRNEPAWVRFTANSLAEHRGLTPAEFAAATTANARRLFRLDTTA